MWSHGGRLPDLFLRDSADTLAILSCEGHHYDEFVHAGRSQMFVVILSLFAYLNYFWKPFVTFCDIRRVSKPTIAFFIIWGWISGGILTTRGFWEAFWAPRGYPQAPPGAKWSTFTYFFSNHFYGCFFDAPQDFCTKWNFKAWRRQCLDCTGVGETHKHSFQHKSSQGCILRYVGVILEGPWKAFGLNIRSHMFRKSFSYMRLSL